MASPVGHYLVGLSIAHVMARDETERRRGFWLAAITLLPDLDIAVGIGLGYLWAFHRGISHSLAIAAVISLLSLAALLLWKSKSPFYISILIFLLYASHIALDFFSFDRGSFPGVLLFWPLTSEPYQSPWSLLPSVVNQTGAPIRLNSFIVILREVILFTPLYGLVYTLRFSRRPLPRPMLWLYSGWFVIAAGASLVFL